MKFGSLPAALIAVGVVIFGQAAADEGTRPAAATRHEAGRAIYNFRCYFCHGYSGDARTLAATYLSPPPRDFVALPPDGISRQAMVRAVTEGRPGTAMKSFSSVLSGEEIGLVVDFVRTEFMRRKAVNTRYHTEENGWINHERHRIAYPFATGEVPLDRPWSELTDVQRRGKRLFLSACVTCHDHARTLDPGPVWEGRAVSYPRNQHQPGGGDTPATKDEAVASASPYLLHDVVPKLEGLSAVEKTGEHLFQKNCAFCHAADGTGKNWIGSFMEPHPRNLTDPSFMKSMTRSRLARTIAEGLPNTSMPAWKHVLSSDEIEAIVAYVNVAFHPLADPN